jgi:glycosyltransferase involved in cell wall biosynthesis
LTKVLLIPDKPNWALDKNARDLVKYNKSNLQLDICYYEDFEKEWKKYYSEYDLLFPMFKGLLKNMIKKKIPTYSSVTGIRSYYNWDKGKTQPPGYNAKPPLKVIRRLKKALLVNTHCKKLWYVFSKYLPVIHTKYTCDLEIFYPDKKKNNDKLVVGWTGSLTNHPNKRGFHEYIKPACDAIPGIELKVQASENNMITDNNEMRQFYNSLDLYICASRAEGTPRPVIEAAACGVPVISTDVGIVPELIEDNINGFVVNRKLEEFKSKLEWINGNREILQKMGDKIRYKMERQFNWDTIIYQWTEFLEYGIELKNLKRNGAIK